jgi:hypothetical protein
MARVAVIVFETDEQEMRLRSALSAAKRGDEEAAGQYLIGALKHGYIDVLSSGQVVPR